MKQPLRVKKIEPAKVIWTTPLFSSLSKRKEDNRVEYVPIEALINWIR